MSNRNQPTDLASRFAAVAQDSAARTALVEGDERWTYADLLERSGGIAAALLDAGVSPGEPVPLLMGRGARQVIATLGVLRVGAVYVPLDPTYPEQRLRRMLAVLGGGVGLLEPGVQPPAGARTWLDAADLPAAAAPRLPSRGGDDPAYVMFTSGSTGSPKAVLVPHRAVLRLVTGQSFAEMGPDETWLHMAPPAFDAATLEIWAPLLHGGRCVVLGAGLPSAAVLRTTIERYRVTSAWLTSSLFNALIDDAPECLRGLRQILTGGEALSPSHVRRALELLPGTTLVNGYGPTENTTFTCCHRISSEDVAEGRTVPIGRPIAGTTVRVLDRDGREAPIGVPGELVAGGLGVALGYVGDDELTAARFVPDPPSDRPGARMYRTGDRVRWRPEGVLEFLGRFDDQVKIRGHRIEPGEVTAVLEEHSDVRQAVVIVHGVGSDAARLVAFVVAKDVDRTEGLEATLHEHAATHLPAFLRPAVIRLLATLPLTDNGKIDRARLPTVAGSAGTAAPRSPQNPHEAQVLEIWRRLLGAPEAGMDDDFFEAGGTSIVAVRLAAEIEAAFGGRFDFETFLSRPTPASVARSVSVASSTREFPEVVVLRDGSSDATLFCVPGLGGHVFSFRKLAELMPPEVRVIGLQTHELERRDGALESIEDMAAVLARAIEYAAPNGHILLLGYSLGAIVAFEVARQLEHAGRAPVMLAMIDGYAPGTLRPASLSRKARLHVMEIARLGLTGGLRYVLGRVQHRALRLRGLETEGERRRRDRRALAGERLREIEERSHAALACYNPDGIDTPIRFIRATRLNQWIQSDEAVSSGGWDALSRGGVKNLEVDCEHRAIFNEPHLTELATSLTALIAEAVSREPASQPIDTHAVRPCASRTTLTRD